MIAGMLNFIQRLICRHPHEIIKRHNGTGWWECTTCFRTRMLPDCLTGEPKGAFNKRARVVSGSHYHAWKVRQRILSEDRQEDLEDWYRRQEGEK